MPKLGKRVLQELEAVLVSGNSIFCPREPKKRRRAPEGSYAEPSSEGDTQSDHGSEVENDSESLSEDDNWSDQGSQDRGPPSQPQFDSQIEPPVAPPVENQIELDVDPQVDFPFKLQITLRGRPQTESWNEFVPHRSLLAHCKRNVTSEVDNRIPGYVRTRKSWRYLKPQIATSRTFCFATF